MSNEVQAALIGAVIAGILTLAGSLVNSHLESRRMTEENRKRDSDWRREKCDHAYSEAIYYLFKLEVSSQLHGIGDKDVRQHLSEAQRHLALLQAYHPQDPVRQQLGKVAFDLQKSAEPQAESSMSTQAAQARRVVEESLQSTWSPTIR